MFNYQSGSITNQRVRIQQVYVLLPEWLYYKSACTHSTTLCSITRVVVSQISVYAFHNFMFYYQSGCITNQRVRIQQVYVQLPEW